MDNARQRIVKEEMKKLEEGHYITSDVSEKVVKAHEQYAADMEQLEVEKEQARAAHTEELKLSEKAGTAPAKKKKVLSAKELRDRNITWSLNLGVILLLIGGLVLATSTWETLADWVKSGLVALVALLFFGLAVFTMRVLKIEKTAFAFFVLGGLFLPIALLSAGFFELLGPYFSLTGEGRYLFGAASSLIVLPIYLKLADSLSSRLFVWFSYVTVTAFAGFLLAATGLPVDGFYLGIMLFNGLLLFLYSRFRSDRRLALFVREFVRYIQCSLVLSTLMMLVFYNHEMLYGFNLLLTAVLYFAMIYTTAHKAYSFVFSAMLVYGAYQLIEFSDVGGTDPVVYAMLGFIFLVIPRFIENDKALTKIFRSISAVVSGCAFLYISLEGIFLRMNEPSFVLLLAYALIALNFAFLSNMTNRQLFAYLSPVFLLSALFEVVLFSRQWFGYDDYILPLFLMALFLYIVFGCLMQVVFFQRLKKSSRDLGGVVMVLAVFGAFILMNWWQAGIMLLLLSATALLTNRYDNRAVLIQSAPWIHAISSGLSVIMFYSVATDGSGLYTNEPFQAASFVLAGLVVLLMSATWKYVHQSAFSESTFFIAYVFYGFGMWFALNFGIDAVLRAVIMLGAVGMAYLLYRKTGWAAVSYVVSGISLLFYMTVLYAIYSELTVQSELFQSLQFVMGAVLLLIAGALAGKYDAQLRKGFGWVGHVFLPFALLTSFGLSGTTSVWAFMLAAVVYGISLRWARVEWLILSFLYGGFTVFWAGLVQWFKLLNLNDAVQYAALLVSLLLAVGWFVMKGVWAIRIAYYAVPFSVFGMLLFTFVPDFNTTTFVITLLYSVLTLVMMHQAKWDLFNVVPLLLAYSAIWLYEDAFMPPDYAMLFRLIGFAGVLVMTGMLMYPAVYQAQTNRKIPVKIDWYSVTGFVTLWHLYSVTPDVLWAKLLPGLLIVLFLILQRKRLPYVPAKWLVFGACVYLLQPYYVLLSDVAILDLIERELYVLPWVAAVIFWKKITDQTHKRLVNYVQWAVLVIVSLTLIQDGLASSTIYDALIVGTLSLASMLGGMAYQLKAFFFVGAGVLLLNVFLQTRPYWGNLPWWAYLLIAGSILITVASYNEWHKQKTADGKTTIASTIYQKIIQKIKRWD